MTDSNCLYQINSTNEPDGLKIKEINNSMINPIQEGLESFVTFKMNSKTYTIGFDSANKKAIIYNTYNKEADQYFTLAGNTDIAFGSTIVDVFYMGNIPMLLTYDPTSEYADLVQISEDFKLTSAYQVKIGKGLSTVKTFSYRFSQFFIAYDITSGHVEKFEISIPPHQPVYAEKTWSDKWAQGWTRFSFFQLGGENFFIKTNLKYNKVNIDHFMDDPNESSHPVLDMDAPAQMVGLSDVSAFTNEIGDPFFTTYRSNGEMTFNRINGNCLGWKDLSSETSIKNASDLMSFTVDNKNYVLVYDSGLEVTQNQTQKKEESFV